MGMFDYLRVDRQLPDGTDGSTAQFQTKDFECSMVEYQISAEGRLLQPIWHSEEVPKEQRPFPNDEGFLGLAGSMRTVVDRMHDMNHHGIVNFYRWDAAAKKLHEYNAKFTEGQLVGITRDD